MTSGSLLKKLAGESLIYGVSGVLTRFISVFLVPIYTRIFVPSDYGVVSLVVIIAALLNILLILSLDNSMGRWYYDSEDALDRKITLNTFLWSCLGFAVLFAVLVSGFRGFIATQIIREPATEPLLLLMAANLPLAVFSVFTTNLLRMQRRAAATTIFTITTSLTSIALNILFVIVLRVGIVGIFYAQIITSFIAVIWTFVLFHSQIAPRFFDLTRWRQMLMFSLPLIPGSVAFWVINLSGAYFVGLMNNTHEVGLYYIGSNIASIVAMITGAFQMAWGPFAYSIYKRPEAKHTYSQVLLAFLATTCLLSLGLMLFAREVLTILTTKDYLGAAWVAGLISFNHILIGLGYIASIGTGIAKNNKAFGVAMVASAVVLVVLNLILVPRYGKEGAAASILLSQSLVPIAVFAHGQKLYPIPYKFGKAIAIFLTSLLLGVCGMKFIDYLSLSFLAVVGIKVLLMLLYCSLIFFILRGEISRADILFDDTSAV
jgi:O-antigen/teichoic acid export membrane protein